MSTPSFFKNIVAEHLNSDLKLSGLIVGCTEILINSLLMVYVFHFYDVPQICRMPFAAIWISCALYIYGVHKENSYLILPYLSIRVIFCVGVGACFVLFPILCLAYSVLYGVFPDGFQFISMDFSDVSMHLFWAFVIFCGVGIVIGMQTYFVIVMYSFYKSITQRNERGFYAHIHEFDPNLTQVYLIKDQNIII